MVSIPVGRSLAALVLAALACLPLPGRAIANEGVSFIWPTTGRVTQRYGCTGFWAEPRRGRCAHFHNGMDIADALGTRIFAAADGVVELVGWDPWIKKDPAWMVIIDHGNGLKTMYAHMRARPIKGVTKGAHVTQGQLIGRMDMTGHATGPHLHFAVIQNGEFVNPRRFVSGLPVRRQRRPKRPVCEVPVSGGMGAWLGSGATAMLPPDDGTGVCPA